MGNSKLSRGVLKMADYKELIQDSIDYNKFIKENHEDLIEEYIYYTEGDWIKFCEKKYSECQEVISE